MVILVALGTEGYCVLLATSPKGLRFCKCVINLRRRNKISLLVIQYLHRMSYTMSGRKTLNSKKCASSTDEEEMIDMSLKKNNNCKMLPKNISELFPNNTVEQTRRRGRGPSKRPCLNRNALMARENRQRKKAYLEKIENTLSYYQQENKNLACTIQKQGIDIKRLTGEVAYLKSVLNNNTAITTLLKTINDGLKRFERDKKKLNNQVQSENEIKDSDVQQKCTTFVMNSKENISDSLNYNILGSTANTYCITSNVGQELGNSYESTKKEIDKDNIIIPFSDTDHTYIIPQKPTIGVSEDFDTKMSENNSKLNLLNYVCQIDGKYQQNGDKMMPVMSSTSISTSDGGKSTDITDMDFDELSSFNVDIFKDLPKCDDIMNSIDLNDHSSTCTEEDLFQNLDNTGICLHVNSDKVSLEYCAICHMNSKNSEIE